MRLGIGLLLSVLIYSAVGADEVALIHYSEPWRFFRGTSEPSAPVTAWRQTAFDDSSWETGLSGFGSTGDEGTAFPASPSFRSAYFRKKFNVAAPESIKWLLLRLDYASGFVAYLNGQEIARRNLAGNPVPFDTYATNHARGTAEVFNVSAFLPLLVAGENLLAIQLHRANNNDLVLLPELRANFSRGPYVGNTSSNSIQITWRTPVPSDSVVEFGTSQTLGLAMSNAAPVTNHVVTLTNLLPDRSYFYRVRSRTNGIEAVSPVWSFRTLKPSGDIVFAVIADGHEGAPARYRIADLLTNLGADLVLHAGDMVQHYFTPGNADSRWVSVHDLHMRSTPYFVSFGNHDFLGGASNIQPMFETVLVPTNQATGTKHFYSFDHGDVHFVALLVPTLEAFAGIEPYVLSSNSLQYQWLTNDLAMSTKPWKIAFFHSPILGSGGHRNEDANSNGRADRLELQEMLFPVFRRYGVQAVFSGHDHDYERSVPTNGIHCFVAGGAGSIIMYSIAERDALCAHFWRNHHLLKVRVTGDVLRMEAFDEYGTLFDGATIGRAPPPAQVWPATWNSPVVETSPANDGDGNIIGQSFDFTGTPIPARSGDFSALGDLWVNNDTTNLYVGLSHTLLRSSDNIFLFIESPRLAGVSTMAGLGNGVVDPAGQGVDGLDFVENLSFTNFSPSVACLLGDEFADGQFRSFARPGQAGNIGQGVFRLDAGFSNVPGARVQQFNLSPQPASEGTHEGATSEQNADFLEVAIPYLALGAIHPGDQIKIGAVIGGATLNTTAQTRDLDRGFLGVALHGSGTNAVRLEGLTVQLADYPPGLDSDGDGLLDRWEVDHGLNPFSAVGADGVDGDPDADGFTNWEEQFAGTDPRQPASALRAQSHALDADRVVISWSAVPGRRYALQWTTNLAGPFAVATQLGFPRAAQTNTESIALNVRTLMAEPASLFFRVQVLAP